MTLRDDEELTPQVRTLISELDAEGNLHTAAQTSVRIQILPHRGHDSGAATKKQPQAGGQSKPEFKATVDANDELVVGRGRSQKKADERGCCALEASMSMGIGVVLFQTKSISGDLLLFSEDPRPTTTDSRSVCFCRMTPIAGQGD